MNIAGLCLQRTTRRKIDFSLYLFPLRNGITGTFLCRGLVFHYKYYLVFPIFTYRNQFYKELVVLYLQLKPNFIQYLETNELIFNFLFQLGMLLHFMNISCFCIQRTTRRKCWISHPILLFIIKWNNWYLFCV